jgi:hypothetical protein
MNDNYQKIVLHNLKKLYDPLPPDLAEALPSMKAMRPPFYRWMPWRMLENTHPELL